MMLMRQRLENMGITPAGQLACHADGDTARIAGVVIVRQRPGTAKGFVFITLEDETGFSNAVVTPKVFERWRPFVASPTNAHRRRQSSKPRRRRLPESPTLCPVECPPGLGRVPGLSLTMGRVQGLSLTMGRVQGLSMTMGRVPGLSLGTCPGTFTDNGTCPGTFTEAPTDERPRQWAVPSMSAASTTLANQPRLPPPLARAGPRGCLPRLCHLTDH